MPLVLDHSENLDDGKSPTWFAYAQSVLRERQGDMIHYIAKTESDTVMILDQYFSFVEEHLPPPPHNRNTVAGRPAQLNRKNPGKDLYSNQKYGYKFQPYMQGEWYLMSPDLTYTVVEQAPRSETYSEHFEGHDVGMMALRSEQPIHFIAIQIGSTHWVHPVETNRPKYFHWIWYNEIIRYSQVVGRNATLVDPAMVLSYGMYLDESRGIAAEDNPNQRQ